MVKINSASPWFGASGSLGGITFQTKNGVTTASMRKTKRKSSTNNQQGSLNNFIRFQQQFKSIGSSDRADWYTLAAANDIRKPNGTDKTIQAINWYSSFNTLRSNLGLSQQDSIDTINYAPQLAALDAANASVILNLNFTNYVPGAATTSIIYATDVVRIGGYVGLSQYRIIDVASLDGLNNYDLTSAWSAYFNKVYNSVVNYSDTTVRVGVMTCFDASTYPDYWQIAIAE